MSDFRRTYKIELAADQPIPSIRQLIRKQIRFGARWSDWIEVKRGSEIVVFGLMDEVSRRYAPAKTATESVE
jgi:hypothetical protein